MKPALNILACAESQAPVISAKSGRLYQFRHLSDVFISYAVAGSGPQRPSPQLLARPRAQVCALLAIGGTPVSLPEGSPEIPVPAVSSPIHEAERWQKYYSQGEFFPEIVFVF
jgi:hypothetical protein